MGTYDIFKKRYAKEQTVKPASSASKKTEKVETAKPETVEAEKPSSGMRSLDYFYNHTKAPEPVKANTLESLSASVTPAAGIVHGGRGRSFGTQRPVTAEASNEPARKQTVRPEFADQGISNSRGDTQILTGEPYNLTREGQWAAKHPIAGTLMYGVSNLVGGAEGLINTGEAALRALATGEKMNPHDIHAAPIVQAYRTGTAEGVRRGVEGMAPGFASAVGIDSKDGRYTTGEKASDFLTGVAADRVSSLMGMGVGGGLSTVLMGGQAANQSLYDVSNDPNTTAEQAAKLAIANGIAEAVFEHFSTESLLSKTAPTSVKDFVLKLAAQTGVEFQEEAATEIANIISDYAIRGENSDIARSATGATPNEAAANALRNAIVQVGMAGLGGALSGAMGGAYAMGASTFSGGRDFRSTLRGGMTLEDLSESIDTSTPEGQRVVDIANDIASRERNGQNVGVAEYGFLNNAIENAVDAAEVKEAQERAATAIDEETVTEETAAEAAQEDVAPETTKRETAADYIKRRQAENAARQEATQAMNDVASETAKDTGEAFRNANYYNSQRMTAGERIFNAEMAEDMASTFGEEGQKAFSALPAEEGVKAYREWAAHYNNMRFGMPIREGMSTTLSPEQISAAMRAGALDANRAYPQDTMKAVNRAVSKISVNGVNAGNADLSGIDYKSLTPQQKLRVDYTSTFVTKGLGMDVRYVKSEAVDGKYKGMNGSFQVINGRPTITLDVNAGMNRESDWTGDITDIKSMLPVISHETTHFLEQYNPKLYKELSNTVLTALQNNGTYSKGMTINSIIEAERQRLNDTIKDENGKPVQHTQDDAIHELVARACEDMLSGDKKALDAFNSLDANTKQTLWDHVKQVFDNIREFFAQMLSSYKSDSAEAKAIRQNMEEFEKIRDMWQEALNSESIVHASEVSSSNDTSTGEFSIRQFAQALDFDVRINSEGQAFEIIDPYTGKAIKKVTEEMMEQTPMGFMVRAAQNAGTIDQQTADKQIKMFKDLMNLTLRYDQGTTPMVWEVAGSFLFSSVKTNADKQYSTTVDYGTICSKTQALIDVLSKTMVEKGRGLTRDEVLKAYNETAKTGLSVPCPPCYVFSRWMGVPSLLETMRKCQERFGNVSEQEVQNYINSMLDQYGDAKGVNSEKTKVQKRLETLERKLQEANANKDLAAQADIQKEVRSLEKKMSDLESFNWVTQVRCVKGKNGKYTLDRKYRPVPNEVLLDLRRSGDFAQKYPKSWKYRTTRGAGMGKAIMPYSGATIGDFIKGTKDRWTDAKNPFYSKNDKASRTAIVRAQTRAKAQNLIGGQRFQSTSDFRAEWGIDYLMTFLECQLANSQVQLYTKVIEAVDMFASAGAEVNLSIMPMGDGHKNGKLIFSDVTGINFNDALKKTRKYDNVQMILVGINDDHIRLAMADDRISFIIPWHSSGNSKDTLASLMKSVGETLNNASDYSETQNDKVIDNSEGMKAIREFRKDIIQGKLWENYKNKTVKGLTAEQQSMLDGNKYLSDLYRRFYQDSSAKEYGVRLNGNQSSSIFPYEYWDTSLTVKDADQNGRRFQEYCASLGIQPRFSQFANDTGYWKLLIDRRMYNRDGTYHDPKAIDVTNVKVSQVPQAVNSNNYKDMSKINQATLDTIRAIDEKQNDLTVTEDVTPTISDGSGPQYSTRDSQGKELTESQAEYFKDSKVRDEDGNLLVVYHGTYEDFNVFDSSKGRSNMDIQGSFFSPWDIDAEGYGPNVKTVYLNIKNPAPEGAAYKALNMFKGQNDAGKKARNYLIRQGYDGVNNGDEEYIAFYPEQIKNIDNENPTANSDIRYSTRDIEEAADSEDRPDVIRQGSDEDIQFSTRIADKNLDNRLRVNMATFFSGTGTVDFALRNIVRHEFAVENDAKIAAVYRANNGDNIYVDDVRNVNINPHKGKVEYFHASPVCKSYSNANNDMGEKPLDIETARATADAIRNLEPKVVTVENVARYRNSEAVKIIEEALEESGYDYDVKVYSATDFGGATIRQRMFIRAVKDGVLPEVDTSEHARSWYSVVEDLIPELPPAKLSNYMEERLEPSGIDIDNLDQPVFVLGGEKSGKLTYATADKPAPTLLAKSTEAKILMPDGRVLRATPRVMARIQGLPDGFDLMEKEQGITNAYKIVGNGVPVQLTQGIVGPLLEENLIRQKSEATGVQYSMRGSSEEEIEASDNNVQYSVRHEAPPTETADIYKLMRLDPDGKIRALFIDANGPSYEMGTWYNADAPDISVLDGVEDGYAYLIRDNEIVDSKKLNVKYTKGGTSVSGLPNKNAVNEASNSNARWMAVFTGKNGKRAVHNVGINGSGTVSTFAYRPGIHAGSLPSMQQIGKGPSKNIRDDRFVWVKGKIAYDAETQAEADRKGGEINDRVPEGGYRYRTNSQADDRIGWYISGAFLPERVLSDWEADEIVNEYNEENGTNIPLDHRRENGRVFNAETMQLEDGPQFSQRNANISEAIEKRQRRMEERYLARIDKLTAKSDEKIDKLKAKMRNAVGAEKQKARDRLDKLRNEKNDKIKHLEKAYRLNLDWRIAEMRQEMENAVGAEKQKARERLDALRTQKNQQIDDIISEYRETRLRERLKRRESKAQQELLRRARRLAGMKGDPDFRAQVDALIGDLDLVAAGIRDDTQKKLEEIRKQVEAQSELDPDYAKYETPKYAKLLERPDKKHISQMSIEDILQLTESIVALEHSKRTADHEIGKERRATFGHYGKVATEQLEKTKGINYKNEIGAQLGKYKLNMLNPTRAFSLIDGYQRGGVFTYFGKELNDGQTKAAQFRMEVEKMFQDIDNNPKLVNDFAKQDIEIDTLEGKKKISKGMRIALYLHLQNPDNVKHIAFGGITIPNERLYSRGKYAEAYAAGETVHLSEWDPSVLGESVSDTVNRKNDAAAAAAIRKITDQMTPEELEYAEIAYKFFNETTKDAINEVSLALNGYEKAIVDDYFPISTNKNFLQSSYDGLVKDGTLEGMGMLKERSGSHLPIYLEDASQVVLRQKNNTALYYGLAVPIRNFTRFYNYTGGERLERSVKASVGKTWGKTALDYIDNVLSDLQFGRQTQRSITDTMKSIYAGTTLNLNLGVAIKQSASYPFAASVIGWGPLAKAARHVVSKADREYMDSITPWGYMRRTGFSGTEMGEVAMQRTGIDNNRTIQRVKTALDLIRQVDVRTTEVLFFACEEYVKDKYPDLEVRGGEYNRRLADIYNETLQRTQPSYDVMQRNEYLRKQNDIAKIFGAFKTQTFNMGGEVIDAWSRWRAYSEYAKKDISYVNAKKEAGKAFGNTVAATIVAQGVLVILSAAANAALHRMRDYRDEKGEVTPESIAKKILYDFGTSFAGMTMGGSEAQDFALALLGDGKWYDIDYPGLTLVNDFASAAVDFRKAASKAVETGDMKDIDNASVKMAKLIMQMFKLQGVPAQNVYNIVNAIYLWGTDVKNGEAGTFNAGEGLFGLQDTSPTKWKTTKTSNSKEEP